MESFILIGVSYHISHKTSILKYVIMGNKTGMNHIRIKLLLTLILLMAFILRFWNYDLRYGIGYDGSRDAIVAFESAKQLQLPLTGSFSSIGPITFGPWYYYYITAATFLIPSVWAPWMAIGLASLAMVLVMYKIGNLLINPTFGLLLAFIAAVSPAQISTSTPLQQHALIGLLSSLILYLFIKISLNHESGKISALWGFLSGVAINTHFQATGLLTLPIILFLFSKNKKFILTFLLGIFISMIPILVFELNNHWFNTKNIIDFVLIGQYRIWTSNRWLTFLGKFWPEFWSYTTGLPIVLSPTIMFTTGLLLAVKFIKKKLHVSFIFIGISFVIQIILLRYYRGEKFFGYLQFFHVFIFIYTGYFLHTLFKKIRLGRFKFSLLIIYFLLVFPNSLQYVNADKFNLETRQRLNLLTAKYPNTKFSTFECKKDSDTNRIQGLLLFLYMNKLYAENGEKIAIKNPFCSYGDNKDLEYALVNVNSLSIEKLQLSGLVQMTPQDIYVGTARWWFKEQP